MAITFPKLAADGQLHTLSNGVTYIYDGVQDKWVALSSVGSPSNTTPLVNDIYFGLVNFDANTGDLTIGRNDAYQGVTNIDGRYVSLSGDTVTGPILTSNVAVVANNQLITKSYVDMFVANAVGVDVYTASAIIDANGSLVQTRTDGSAYTVDLFAGLDARYVNVDGDTMTGPLVVNSDLTVTGNTSVNVLEASGDATFNSDVYTNQNLYSNNLSVTNHTQLNSVTTTGNAVFNSTSTFNGDVYTNSELYSTNLTVSGDTVVNTFTASGDATFNSTSTFEGDVYTNQNLISNNVTISGDTVVNNLTATGNTSVNNFTANGTSTFEGDVYTTQNLYSNNVTVSGNTTVNNFTANGTSTFNSNVIINETLTTNNMVIQGDTVFYGNTVFQGTLTASNTDLALSSLNDVNAAAPANNDFLMWNGTEWVNNPVPTTNISHLVNNVMYNSGTLSVFKEDGTSTAYLIPDNDTFVTNAHFNDSTRIFTVTRSDGATFTTTIPEANVNSIPYVNDVSFDANTRNLHIGRIDGFDWDVTIPDSDNQTLAFANNTLTISNGNSVDLSTLAVPETVTSLTRAANFLTYTDENGVATNIDLTVYLDDTNLARLVSGTVDGNTGIATFTRDDATQFNMDFSALFDDTNLTRITSGAVSGNTMTLTRSDSTTVAIDVSSLTVASLAGLTDTTITGAVAGEILSWDGSAWVNQPLPPGTVDTFTVSGTTAANGLMTFTRSDGNQFNADISTYVPSLSLGDLSNVDGEADDIGSTAFMVRNTAGLWRVGGVSIDQLADVTTSGANFPADGQVLAWDSSIGFGTWVPANPATFTETTTSLSFAGNILTYVDEVGANTNIDLSLYLDDTNLARLVSGNVAANGIATFTRDDATTFDVDFSGIVGTSTLGELTDVTITNPQNITQVLKYFNGTWMNMDDGVNVAINTASTDMAVSFVASGTTHTGALLYNPKLLFNPTTGTLTVDGETITAAKIQAWDAATAGSNIYSTDGTLTSHRTINGDAKSLGIVNLSSFNIAANASGILTATNSMNIRSNYLGFARASGAITRFPATTNPSVGDVLTVVSTGIENQLEWAAPSGGGATVSNTSPTSPSTGDLWYDENDARTYVWNGTVWIDASPAAGVSEINDLSDVNTAGVSNGQVLMWDANSSNWIPGSAGGGSSLPTGSFDGQNLVWDSANSAWLAGKSDAVRITNNGSDLNAAGLYSAISGRPAVGPGTIYYNTTSDEFRVADSVGNWKDLTVVDAKFVDLGSLGSITVDADNHIRSFKITMGGATTVSIGGSLNTGYEYGISLTIIGSGDIITWPASVKWLGGAAPADPASGEEAVYVLTTIDGGTSWRGNYVGVYS